MTIAEIQALLEQKFKGERKDGLKLLALHIVMTAGEDDEKAKTAVNELTEDGVKQFIKGWRTDADSEITKATQTAETNLRNKYDFVEKGKPTPPTPPAPEPPAGGITADQLKAAIAEAIKPYAEQVDALKGAATTATRKEQVEALFKDKKVNAAFKKAIMVGFEAQKFEDDAAFNTYLETTKADIDSCVQELADQGLADIAGNPLFGKPDTGDKVSPEVESYIADRQNADKGESPLSGKKI